MRLFVAGLILGSVSGGGTYLFTGDAQLSLIVAAVAALLVWLGVFAVVILEGEL